MMGLIVVTVVVVVVIVDVICSCVREVRGQVVCKERDEGGT